MPPRVAAALLLGCVAHAAVLPGSAPPARYEIGRDQVADAMRAWGLPVLVTQVRMVARLSSTAAQPQLAMQEAEAWGERGARVRVRCAEAQPSCLPFYAMVEWPDQASAKAALHETGVSGKMTPRFSAASILSVDGNQASSPLEHPALRSGARATLLLDGGRLHIQVPVLCLESGAPGRTIRVTALDHKQTYRAEVVDAGVLRGTIQKGEN